MTGFVLHGQQVSMSYTSKFINGTTLYSFKLYVDGDLRDSSDFVCINHRDWRVIARAAVRNASGEKRELQLLVQARGWLKGSVWWRFMFEGSQVG